MSFRSAGLAGVWGQRSGNLDVAVVASATEAIVARVSIDPQSVLKSDLRAQGAGDPARDPVKILVSGSVNHNPGHC